VSTNTFDQTGRLIGFSGNLGDGTARTYSSGILLLRCWRFGERAVWHHPPIYNKPFYNSRGQLAEIRESTNYTGPTDTSWDRGAIINNYSEQCTGMCSGSSMADNNGSLKKHESHVPDQQMRWQQYDYDSLNRLNWAREVFDSGTEQ
jgi:hypothetical protein